MKNPRLIDLTGKQFGEWTVLEKNGNHKCGGAIWLCKCNCGAVRNVMGGDLRSNKSRSCGCKGSQATIGERSATHRMKGTRIHTCWGNMLRRCRNKENKRYGGRGITVCKEWEKFEVFYEWAMKSGYSETLFIERTNNDLGYFPENCTWTDRKTQNRNRSIVHKNQAGISFAEIAEKHGIQVTIMNNRVAAGGWSHEDAATIQVGATRKKLTRDNVTGRFHKSPSPWRR